MDKVYVVTGEDWGGGEKRVLTVCKTEDEAKKALAYFSDNYDNPEYEEFFFETFEGFTPYYRGSFNIALSPTEEENVYYMGAHRFYTTEDYTSKTLKEDFNFNILTAQSSFSGEKTTTLSGNFISLTPPPSEGVKIREFFRDKVNEKGIIKVELPDFTEI